MGTTNKIETTYTRFELEEALIACFNVADDLVLLAEESLEGETGPDELASMLRGLSELHTLRCGKAFRIFSQLIESGNIT